MNGDGTEDWYIVTSDGRQGPFELAKLRSMATVGRIADGTRLQRGADGEVVLAGEVENLVPRFDEDFDAPNRLDGFRSLLGPAWTTCLLTALAIPVHLGAAYAIAAGLAAPANSGDPDGTLVTLAIALARMFAGTAGFIAFLVWFYRAHANVRVLGGSTRFSRASAVWPWFIPLFNFVRPAQVALTIRRTVGSPGIALFALWWSSWIGDQISGAYARIAGGRERRVDVAFTDADVVASAFDALGAVLMLAFVVSVTRAMNAALERAETAA